MEDTVEVTLLRAKVFRLQIQLWILWTMIAVSLLRGCT